MRNRIYALIIVAVSFLPISFSHAALVDNGDGTISDTTTNLMWVQNADLTAPTGSQWYSGQPFSNPPQLVEALVLAGHDDWRLPTIEELENLYATLSSSGAFNPLPFVNLDVDSYSDWFWSSTEKPNGVVSPDYWYFDFELGIRNGRTNFYQGFYVLPVRDTASACDIVDNGDGTVSDRGTGLMWLQNADTISQSWWAASNTAAEALTTGGHTDWRLPTIEDLETLYARLSSSGTFVPAPFVNLDVDGYSDWFWSNTDTGANDYYYFDFELGVRGVRTNSYQALYTLPVRTESAGCN